MRILSAGPSADLTLTTTAEDRVEGVHLSDILVRLAWERNRKYDPNAPKDLMVFEQGHTWETVLARALAERHADRAGYRPKQLLEDGIWCSPDWLNPDAAIQHEEWKATKKSIKNYEQKIDEWAPQAKSYLYVLRRRGLVKRFVTLFRVWFVCGDWSFESKGDLTLLRDYWDIPVEFSEREVLEQWAANVAAGIRFGLLPEKKELKPWERRPTLEATLRKRAGKAQPPSRKKAPLVTFPSGKARRRSSAV